MGEAGSIEADPRWARIVARDASADGLFWYSVTSTGVYCRPSCPSRQARPGQVALHETPEAARGAGYRACLRCRPDEAGDASPGAGARARAALVARACRLIEGAEEAPSAGALARAAGVSVGHLHRLFRAELGVTPKGYAAAHRAGRVRDALAAGASVTAAIHSAGFGSSGRFYEGSTAMLGMTPSRYRAGGAGETLRFAVGQTTLGAILVASSAQGVAAILLGDDPEALLRDLQDRFRQARLVGGDASYEAVVASVVALVEAPRRGLDLPLDLRGTAFQRLVWQALRRVPAGGTVSYAELAARIGRPEAVRAVAGACAANAHAVAIPCHRVVRRDGGLSGYAWGVARKRAFLQREGAVV